MLAAVAEWDGPAVLPPLTALRVAGLRSHSRSLESPARDIDAPRCLAELFRHCPVLALLIQKRLSNRTGELAAAQTQA
jgi:hypothetical protein